MPNELIALRSQAEKLFEEEKFAEVIGLLNDEVLEKYQDAELYALASEGTLSN